MPVWQRGHQLVLKVYGLSDKFPKKETFSLADQIRRAVVSVTSNIAEGYGRTAWKDKCHFYVISMGSLREVQNQLMIARDLKYISAADTEPLLDEADQIIRLIYALMKNTKKRSSLLSTNF